VNSGGVVSPGSSPGILNTGDVTFTSGSTFTAELNSPYSSAGTDYDQLNVTGGVTLGNATLNLVGAAAPAAGTVLTIIKNDGSDAINGTFNGLPDGAVVSVGSFTGFISYVGGDGNDVTLTVSSAATFDGDATSENFEIRRVSNTLQLLRNGVVVDARPIASLSSSTVNANDR